MLGSIDRRHVLQGAAALAALQVSDSVAQTPGASSPPQAPSARIEPVQETFFGETITDPYRWMENSADPEWKPYMEANAAHARATLDAIPGRAAMEARIAALTGAFDIVTTVQSADEKMFYTKRPAGWQSPALYVRDKAGGAETLLVNPNDAKIDDKHVSLDWWQPSHDGAHIVYGLSPAGSENSVLHVMRVADRTILPERIDRTQYASPVWLPDSSGFFYNRLAGAAPGTTDYYLDSVCWLHRLGQDPAQDKRMLARGQYEAVTAERTDFPFLYTNPTSQSVVAIMFGGVRRENPIWTARLSDLLAGRPRWRAACTIDDQVIGSDLRGDTLFMLTTKDAENGKVLATSAARPSFANARTLVAESETVIQSIASARDALYVLDMDGGYSRLRRVEDQTSTSPVTSVPLPFDGSISGLDYSATQDGLSMFLVSWLEPSGFWRYTPGQALVNTGLAPRPPIDTSAYEAIRTYATARDGTKVPLSIVVKKGAPRDGSSPTLVSAYGSYQIPSQPFFWTRGIAFLEQGGVLATAHVRGGGEYGRRWWKAGQKANKPNTWRDLIDCCEHLVKTGFTAPSKLAINGGSAGGITVGRALTERPDLFAAVIPQVGVLNALRAEFSQNGPPNIDEFGTVTTEEGFRGLKAMDSLHAVKDGTRYPAVLLTHGMTDPRVEPWHSGKMVARLRTADPNGGPFLMRVTFDAGHGLGSTRGQLDQEWADTFSFVLWRTGASGFQPQTKPANVIVGGYGTSNPEDPRLAEARRLAVRELYRRFPTRARVEDVSAETQVVAGLNYRFTITLSGAKRYRVVVYRPLRGAMRVTEVSPLD